MSEFVTATRSGRMTAPTYMQPRKPVLDEPLDFDRGQHTIAMPSRQAAVAVPVVDETLTDTAPILVEETVIEAGVPADNNVYYAELAGQQSIAEQPAQFVAEASVEAASETEAPPERKRRKLTKLQQVIVILLEVLVLLVLATVYLYITDRIDLPPVVLDVIEKGLSLIP